MNGIIFAFKPCSLPLPPLPPFLTHSLLHLFRPILFLFLTLLSYVPLTSHTCTLSLSPWAMLVVSCTQPQPMSTKAIIHTTSPNYPFQTVMHNTLSLQFTTNNHPHNHHHHHPCHHRPNDLLLIPHRRKIASPSLPFLPYQSSATSSSSATPRVVSILLFIVCLFIHDVSHRCRFHAFLHTPQGTWRWLLWHSLVVRLAWDLTPQYALVPHAVWCRSETGVDW